MQSGVHEEISSGSIVHCKKTASLEEAVDQIVTSPVISKFSETYMSPSFELSSRSTHQRRNCSCSNPVIKVDPESTKQWKLSFIAITKGSLHLPVYIWPVSDHPVRMKITTSFRQIVHYLIRGRLSISVVAITVFRPLFAPAFNMYLYLTVSTGVHVSVYCSCRRIIYLFILLI